MTNFLYTEADIESALAQTRRLLLQGVDHITNGGFAGTNLCILVLTGPDARRLGNSMSRAGQLLLDLTYGSAVEKTVEVIERPAPTKNDPSRN